MRQSFLILFFACAVHAQMIGSARRRLLVASSGPAFVQSVLYNQGGGTSAVLHFTGVTAGHQLIAMFGLHSTASAISCADNAGAGSTYTSVINGTDAAGLVGHECHTLSAAAGGTVDLTVSWTGSTYGVFFGVEASGVTALDASGSTNQAGNTTWTWPQITTTGSKDLVLAYGGDGNHQNTYTPGANYAIPTTNGQVAGSGQSGLIEYRIKSGAGTEQPTATLGSANAGSLFVAAYK